MVDFEAVIANFRLFRGKEKLFFRTAWPRVTSKSGPRAIQHCNTRSLTIGIFDRDDSGLQEIQMVVKVGFNGNCTRVTVWSHGTFPTAHSSLWLSRLLLLLNTSRRSTSGFSLSFRFSLGKECGVRDGCYYFCFISGVYRWRSLNCNDRVCTCSSFK